MNRKLYQQLANIVTQWRRSTNTGNEDTSQNFDLHVPFEESTEELVEESAQLVIGFVQCNKCGFRWEALAYSSTVEVLECPQCGEQDSRVVGAAINDTLSLD